MIKMIQLTSWYHSVTFFSVHKRFRDVTFVVNSTRVVELAWLTYYEKPFQKQDRYFSSMIPHKKQSLYTVQLIRSVDLFQSFLYAHGHPVKNANEEKGEFIFVVTIFWWNKKPNNYAVGFLKNIERTCSVLHVW